MTGKEERTVGTLRGAVAVLVSRGWTPERIHAVVTGAISDTAADEEER